MARKPTIYKFAISLADIDRGRYDDLNLTVALHPSETVERMLVRVLARCLEDTEELSFTGGLSEGETPDLWHREADGRIATWIEVGEPSAERLRKASRLASRVVVYSFNSRSPVWWSQLSGSLDPGMVEVHRLPWDQVRTLAPLAERSAAFTVTIARPAILVAGSAGEFELTLETLDPGPDQETKR